MNAISKKLTVTIGVLCVEMSHSLQHLVATFLPELHSVCLPLMAITPQVPLSILQR